MKIPKNIEAINITFLLLFTLWEYFNQKGVEIITPTRKEAKIKVAIRFIDRPEGWIITKDTA